MKRKASAVWQGTLKDGKGTISTDSGVLKDAQYSFSTRFENGIGTNPEELIAAAHAGCFSMALSGQLGGANLKAERIATTATVTMERLEAGWTLTAVHLDVTAKVPGAIPAAFATAAGNAKAGRPNFPCIECHHHHGCKTGAVSRSRFCRLICHETHAKLPLRCLGSKGAELMRTTTKER